jgi:hypothetical protein
VRRPVHYSGRETTCHDSTAGAWHHFRAGIGDGGRMTPSTCIS